MTTETQRIADRVLARYLEQRGTCRNCGAILDSWGLCPYVKPEEAMVGIQTCNTIHPNGCMCSPCLQRRDATSRILELTASRS